MKTIFLISLVLLSSCKFPNFKRAGSGGGSGGGSGNLGLKQSIAKFLCDEELPSERVESLNSSLDNVIGFEEKSNKALREAVRTDLICNSKDNINSNFLSDIDSMLDVSSDLDINDEENFLGDYKDFSSSFCSMIDSDCSDAIKSSKKRSCLSLSSMANGSMTRMPYDIIKKIGLIDINKSKDLNKLQSTLNGLILNPDYSDKEAGDKIEEYLKKNHADTLSPEEILAYKEKTILLRSHSTNLNLRKLVMLAFASEEPPTGLKNRLGDYNKANWYVFFQTDEGKKFLNEMKDKSVARKINGILLHDSSLFVESTEADNLFADIYTNGHKLNDTNDKAPRYITLGPEVDTSHYGYNSGSSDSQTPSDTVGARDVVDVKLPPIFTFPDSSKSHQSPSSRKIRTLDDLASRGNPPYEIKPPKIILPDIKIGEGEKAKVEEEPIKVAQKQEEKTLEAKPKENSSSQGDNSQTISFTSQSSNFTQSSDQDISGSRSIASTNEESFEDRLKRQKMLNEITRIRKEISDLESSENEGSGNDFQNNSDESQKLRDRISSLERDFENRARNSNRVRPNNSSWNSSISSDTNPDYWKNLSDRGDDYNPRDPFKRAETKREITPEHMDNIDPTGTPISGKAGTKGKITAGQGGQVGLLGGLSEENGVLEALGLKPLRKRGPANYIDELEPEEICGFDQQELNCIFEHSEIFVRYKRDQILSLVEGLLLHGHTFKTIEIIKHRDTRIPNKYIIHVFEPDKNLSTEDKTKQLQLIKKMLMDFKNNFNFLKAVASKVTRTRSIEINKKDAFTILKHTLKKNDIDKLIKRRLSLIERLPASKK